MKTFGIGTDIVKIDRLKKISKKKDFLSRIFHKNEILKCKKTKKYLNCLAKRFAAKEAFSKALGTGISRGISFKEIIVQNQKSVKPIIILLHNTKKIVEKKIGKKKYVISLSVADEDNYAVAFVTISIWEKNRL